MGSELMKTLRGKVVHAVAAPIILNHTKRSFYRKGLDRYRHRLGLPTCAPTSPPRAWELLAHPPAPVLHLTSGRSLSGIPTATCARVANLCFGGHQSSPLSHTKCPGGRRQVARRGEAWCPVRAAASAQAAPAPDLRASGQQAALQEHGWPGLVDARTQTPARSAGRQLRASACACLGRAVVWTLLGSGLVPCAPELQVAAGISRRGATT